MTASRVRTPAVAVLGAGIMGGSVALFLARRGVRTVLMDAAESPFTGASRWNEGKIHLGYLYTADPTLETARKLIPGGLSFRSLVSELTGQPLEAGTETAENDIYFIHRDSVVDLDGSFALARRMAELAETHPNAGSHFVPLQQNRPRRLDRAELDRLCDTSRIVGGYEVPERSVPTNLVADRFVDALAGTPGIEPLMRRRVRAVRGDGSRWSVDTTAPDGRPETLGPFDAVVNALWEGRAEVDATAGIARAPTWTNRFRLSLFARTRTLTTLRSAVIAVGPFGDVKNYNGRDLYLSWYPAGLMLESHALRPPPVTLPDAAESSRIVEQVLDALAAHFPAIAEVRDTFEESALRGGWVHAGGQGALDDPASELHRRDRIGVAAKDGFFSVDTGKYSMAPWIACKLAGMICERLGAPG